VHGAAVLRHGRLRRLRRAAVRRHRRVQPLQLRVAVLQQRACQVMLATSWDANPVIFREARVHNACRRR
jgi:hypothetical protein